MKELNMKSSLSWSWICTAVLLTLLSTFTEGTQDVIQAEVPPRTSYTGTSCRQTIFNHNFASSYGIPYVGVYNPPQSCNFTTTIFNISVTSQGRQYDRLALLFFNSTELWRTSTAMPSEDGIYWSFQKDMTVFDSLLRSKQKVIFDLSNVYSDLYTGAFNVTVEALYYNDVYTSTLTPPDQIFPISALAASQNISSIMSLPDDNGTVSLILPRNIKTAVVSMLATGNGAEEFWYTNVPSEYVETFPSNEGWLYGYSPFREIQLMIDDNLAGVSWPFPSLFTGGVDPGLWRPIVGIDAYDLPSFEIDVTPWLPLLCDGEPHTFAIRVVGFDNSAEGHIGTIGENWWVTGSVFIWLDRDSNQTTGGSITSTLPATTFNYDPILTTVVSHNTTTNSSFYFSLTASRSLSISSTIRTSSGSKNVSWTQDLSFSNIQNMTSLAYNQSLAMLSTGSCTSSSGIKTTYSYPLNLYSAYVIAETSSTLSSVLALIDRSLSISGLRTLSSYFTGVLVDKENLATRQVGENRYYWNETIVEGTDADVGVMEQWYSYAGNSGLKGIAGVREYSRHVKEVNGVFLFDDEAWSTMIVPSTEPLPYVEGEPAV